MRLHFIFNCYKHKLLKADKAVSYLQHFCFPEVAAFHTRWLGGDGGAQAPCPTCAARCQGARSTPPHITMPTAFVLLFLTWAHLWEHPRPSQPRSFPQSGLAEGYLQRKTWPASPAQKDPKFLHKSRPCNPNFDALTHAYGVFSFKTNPTSFTCPALSWGSEQRNLCFSPISNSNSLCDCSSIPIRNITKPDCTSWEWFVQELGLVMTLPY